MKPVDESELDDLRMNIGELTKEIGIVVYSERFKSRLDFGVSNGSGMIEVSQHYNGGQLQEIGSYVPSEITKELVDKILFNHLKFLTTETERLLTSSPHHRSHKTIEAPASDGAFMS